MNDNKRVADYLLCPSSGQIRDKFFSITDHYTHYSEIESRGYNCLYKAQRHGKWFVLKGLKPEFRNDSAYRLMLEKEYEILITLSCPNIVQVFDKEDNLLIGPCIVMEYINGRTLAEIIQSKEKIAYPLKFLWQMLNGMEYLSRHQIVHRDIKPDNIMITNNGSNVKIVDFGLADKDNFAYYKQTVGVSIYMAPELLNEGAVPDCRSDIYSLGKVLEILSIKPFIRWKCLRPNPASRFSCPTAVKSFLRSEYVLKAVLLMVLLQMGLLVAVLFLLKLGIV